MENIDHHGEERFIGRVQCTLEHGLRTRNVTSSTDEKFVLSPVPSFSLRTDSSFCLSRCTLLLLFQHNMLNAQRAVGTNWYLYNISPL